LPLKGAYEAHTTSLIQENNEHEFHFATCLLKVASSIAVTLYLWVISKHPCFISVTTLAKKFSSDVVCLNGSKDSHMKLFLLTAEKMNELCHTF
jgi:hypothetical protein